MVSGVVLVLVAFLVHGLFGLVVTHSENTVMNDRVQLAKQLAQEGVSPEDLVARVDTHSVRARLVLSDGRTFGSLDHRLAEDSTTKTRFLRLSGPGAINDSRLTMQIDTPLLARVQSRLAFLLVLATAGAIGVIAVGLWFLVRRALAPLDTMTRLARDIARGHLGRRLNPSRTDTELGRTAAAFDEMLDALEGALRDTAAAEARARASEQQIRVFVGDAAHELRTPITGVRSLAEAVFQQPADTDPEDRQRMLLLLVRETQRAGRLVDDLLDLARIDAGLHLRRAPVDLRALTATHLDRMRILHPHIDFQLTGDPPPVSADPVTVSADPVRITQILTNLLTNACQAMKDHGTITVALRPIQPESPLPSSVELTVTDTGPGIPPEDRERIFDRLVRLDQARDHRPDGSGLGLAIARGLARAHGGDLTCDEPPPGRSGAVFTLRLPIAPN
ncbi:HAMP domain-containing sensor histidine kinase [Nocardia sp. CDC153]|uniref:sensor histidine kinase n=1 Tax=Nocardia sp. CDC153 TaxID=3112167 RepID=UPI002DB962ED|nr:HAMP domain-containing sensor histidine kinase [Nocardia sp. CDC153]MEC3952174.1 HAMP domain-containing sensor histidine kinase [Nocardia sp. CDC153]